MAARKARQADKPLDAATIRRLVEAANTAMAAEKISRNDAPHERLFAILMARFDALQARRPDYMAMLAGLRAQPQLLAHFVPLVLRGLRAALKQAELAQPEPRLTAQVMGLFGVYALTLRAWEKDTSADLSSTMRVLDQNLQRAGRAASWLGFEAA